MGSRIHELPEDDRPREKLQRRGAGALTDAELLAIFLRVGRQGASAIEVAQDMLREFGSLNGIARATPQRLTEIPGIGPAKASEIAAISEMGSRLAGERVRESPIDTPEAIYDLLGPEMSLLERESLRIVLVNTRHALLRVEEVALGSLNETVAHPREILRPALVHGAFGFVLVHNHPSGDPSPSAADRQLTRRIADASALLRIALLDHVIIGRPGDGTPGYFSFAESGILPPQPLQ